MPSWFKTQWDDVKGNAKYGLLVSVPFIAGVITRGLLWWQQLVLAFLCVIVVGWAIAQTVKVDRLTQRKDRLGDRSFLGIYIGPSGVPVSIENGKMNVHLKIFSCTRVRLLHVKIFVGGSPPIATLSDPEPSDIKAGEVFSKSVDGKLEGGIRSLLAAKLGDAIHVQGTAKFSDDTADQAFHFDAVPLFLGQY